MIHLWYIYEWIAVSSEKKTPLHLRNSLSQVALESGIQRSQVKSRNRILLTGAGFQAIKQYFSHFVGSVAIQREPGTYSDWSEPTGIGNSSQAAICFQLSTHFHGFLRRGLKQKRWTIGSNGPSWQDWWVRFRSRQPSPTAGCCDVCHFLEHSDEDFIESYRWVYIFMKYIEHIKPDMHLDNFVPQLFMSRKIYGQQNKHVIYG